MGLLYEAECKDVDPVSLLATLEIAPDAFAEDLVRGVSGCMGELDQLVASKAVGWDLDRMPALDRAVLRMAAYELAHRPDSPMAVVLAEAVDLASRFSTEGSGRFVNGVLASIASAVRGSAPPPGPDSPAGTDSPAGPDAPAGVDPPPGTDQSGGLARPDAEDGSAPSGARPPGG